MSNRKATYAEFWPFYLAEHGQSNTRILHFIGTGLAILFLLGAVFLRNPWFLLMAVVSGYFFAWIGHFFIERNRPATFTHPLWSLFSDFRMFFAWITGNLDAELKKAGVETD